MLPRQIDSLARVLDETQAQQLILDPLLAFLDPAVNIGSDPLVRRALAPLSALAAARRCAMMCMRHLDKSNQGQALYRGLASIAFVAACRIAWLIAADPEVAGRFVLAQTKNNLQARPSSLAFQVVGAEGDRQRIEWLGPVAWSDRDLLGVQVRRTKRQRACEFLSAFLAQGPQPRRTIAKAAREAGLTIDMLRGAARTLRISTVASATSTATPPTGTSPTRSSPPTSYRPAPPSSTPISASSKPT